MDRINALAKKKKTKIYEMGLGSEIGTFGGVPVRALGPCMAEQSGLYYAQAPVWIGAGGGIVLSAAVNYEKVAVAVQTLLPEVILTGLSFMEIYQSGQESAAARFAPVEVRVNPDCKQQISAALPDAVVGTSGSAYEYRVRLNQWE